MLQPREVLSAGGGAGGGGGDGQALGASSPRPLILHILKRKHELLTLLHALEHGEHPSKRTCRQPAATPATPQHHHTQRELEEHEEEREEERDGDGDEGPGVDFVLTQPMPEEECQSLASHPPRANPTAPSEPEEHAKPVSSLSSSESASSRSSCPSQLQVHLQPLGGGERGGDPLAHLPASFSARPPLGCKGTVPSQPSQPMQQRQGGEEGPAAVAAEVGSSPQPPAPAQQQPAPPVVVPMVVAPPPSPPPPLAATPQPAPSPALPLPSSPSSLSTTPSPSPTPRLVLHRALDLRFRQPLVSVSCTHSPRLASHWLCGCTPPALVVLVQLDSLWVQPGRPLPTSSAMRHHAMDVSWCVSRLRRAGQRGEAEQADQSRASTTVAGARHGSPSPGTEGGQAGCECEVVGATVTVDGVCAIIGETHGEPFILCTVVSDDPQHEPERQLRGSLIRTGQYDRASLALVDLRTAGVGVILSPSHVVVFSLSQLRCGHLVRPQHSLVESPTPALQATTVCAVSRVPTLPDHILWARTTAQGTRVGMWNFRLGTQTHSFALEPVVRFSNGFCCAAVGAAAEDVRMLVVGVGGRGLRTFALKAQHTPKSLASFPILPPPDPRKEGSEQSAVPPIVPHRACPPFLFSAHADSRQLCVLHVPSLSPLSFHPIKLVAPVVGCELERRTDGSWVGVVGLRNGHVLVLTECQ